MHGLMRGGTVRAADIACRYLRCKEVGRQTRTLRREERRGGVLCSMEEDTVTAEGTDGRTGHHKAFWLQSISLISSRSAAAELPLMHASELTQYYFTAC